MVYEPIGWDSRNVKLPFEIVCRLPRAKRGGLLPKEIGLGEY